ncbi:MAG: PIN domain-containing protein [Candidatus Binatus sp.]
MIVFDTDVLSALMQRAADPAVVAWLDSQPPESVWTTAVTVFEIRFGLELLAPGRRRRQLEEAFSRALDEDFQGRILPFDRDAAHEAASRAAERRAVGKPVDFRDIEIAASFPRGGRRSLRVTFGTSRISGLIWSIRGRGANPVDSTPLLG